VVITQGNVIVKGGILSSSLEVSGPKPGQRVTVGQGGITCRTLIATDETGQQQLAVVSSNPDGGLLRTYGTHTGTHAVLGNFKQYAGLLFIDARGAAHAGPLYGSPVPLRKPDEQSSPAGTSSAPNDAAQPSAVQPSGEQTPPSAESPEPVQENGPVQESEPAGGEASKPAEEAASAAQP
jgi:hypothetical protein